MIWGPISHSNEIRVIFSSEPTLYCIASNNHSTTNYLVHLSGSFSLAVFYPAAFLWFAFFWIMWSSCGPSVIFYIGFITFLFGFYWILLDFPDFIGLGIGHLISCRWTTDTLLARVRFPETGEPRLHNLCTICEQSLHNLCTISAQSLHNPKVKRSFFYLFPLTFDSCTLYNCTTVQVFFFF
jgi:hypothetical protein